MNSHQGQCRGPFRICGTVLNAFSRRVGPWEGFPAAPAGQVGSQPGLGVTRGVGAVPPTFPRERSRSDSPGRRGQYRGSIFVRDKGRGSRTPPAKSHRPATRVGSRASGLSGRSVRGGHIRAPGLTSGVTICGRPRHRPVYAGFTAGIQPRNHTMLRFRGTEEENHAQRKSQIRYADQT